MTTSILQDTMSPPPAPNGQPARFRPYPTAEHQVSKARYITSNDPRGYIPVYEYPLNGQWIMMDTDDGFILWTGIWKALGNSKADIVKMIDSQPDLASCIRRVRGGYLKIQGTWMPYEVARGLSQRVAWPIRHHLIPIFGPSFPDSCLSPDQPGYGQVVMGGSGRRRTRRSAAQSQPGAAAKSSSSLASRSRASATTTATVTATPAATSHHQTQTPPQDSGPASQWKGLIPSQHLNDHTSDRHGHHHHQQQQQQHQQHQRPHHAERYQPYQHQPHQQQNQHHTGGKYVPSSPPAAAMALPASRQPAHMRTSSSSSSSPFAHHPLSSSTTAPAPSPWTRSYSPPPPSYRTSPRMAMEHAPRGSGRAISGHTSLSSLEPLLPPSSGPAPSSMNRSRENDRYSPYADRAAGIRTSPPALSVSIHHHHHHQVRRRSSPLVPHAVITNAERRSHSFTDIRIPPVHLSSPSLPLLSVPAAAFAPITSPSRRVRGTTSLVLPPISTLDDNASGAAARPGSDADSAGLEVLERLRRTDDDEDGGRKPEHVHDDGWSVFTSRSQQQPSSPSIFVQHHPTDARVSDARESGNAYSSSRSYDPTRDRDHLATTTTAGDGGASSSGAPSPILPMTPPLLGGDYHRHHYHYHYDLNAAPGAVVLLDSHSRKRKAALTEEEEEEEEEVEGGGDQVYRDEYSAQEYRRRRRHPRYRPARSPSRLSSPEAEVEHARPAARGWHADDSNSASNGEDNDDGGDLLGDHIDDASKHEEYPQQAHRRLSADDDVDELEDDDDEAGQTRVQQQAQTQAKLDAAATTTNEGGPARQPFRPW